MTSEQLQRANELTTLIGKLEQHQQYLPAVKEKLGHPSTDIKISYPIRGAWDQFVLYDDLLPINTANMLALYEMALAKRIEEMKAELAAL